VGQPAVILAASVRLRPGFVCLLLSRDLAPALCASVTTGVGHPPDAVSEIGGTDACRRGNQRSDGVAECTQVIAYNVEPSLPVRSRYLFANDSERALLADEPMRGRPEMAIVSEPAATACRAERLAGAGHCPDGAIVAPASQPEGVGPESNACEEVDLGVAVEVGGQDIADVSGVDMSGNNVPCSGEVSQPQGTVSVGVVEVGGD